MDNANKKALEDMLFYYLYSLIKEGAKDPVQIIATELPQMIHATEEQINYIKMNILQDNNLVDNISSSIELLRSIEESKVLDLESIQIVIRILEIMKENATTSINKVLEEGDNE